MLRALRALFLVLVMLVPCGSAPAAAQSADLADAVAEFSREVGSYIDAVRFDQADVDSFLAGWPEVNAIFDQGSDSGDDESMEEALVEISDLIATASANQQYRAWASANGLDADDWIRKSMRILLLSQRQTVIQERGVIDIEGQIAQIEAQRDTYGDETADEIIAATRAMGAYFDAFEQVGTPTADEEALLDSHWPQLVTAMNTGGGGRGDDDWGDDEWSDDEWGEEEEWGDDEYGADVDVDIALPDGALPFDPMDTSFSDYFHGPSYVVQQSGAATAQFFLESTDRHCRIDDESEMAQDEGTTTIYTLYCLTHQGELEEGDDVLAVIIMDARARMIRELFGRREMGWSAFSFQRWIEEY